MNSKIPAIAAAVVLFLVLPLAGLGVALVGALGGPLAGGCGGDGGVGGGSQQIGGRVWSAEQMTNAQTIVARAVALGLPKRAAVIAMSTGIVESRLENLDHGDKDSLGVFGQRPSQGWGSPAQILNPRASADAFYDRLVKVPNWQSKPAGVAADLVQNSAHPERYAPQEATAAALVDRFWQGPDLPPSAAPGTDTNPDAPTSPGAPTAPAASSEAGVVAPACPDDGESDLPAIGPLDRSALPPGFTLPADPQQQRAVAFALAQVGKRYVFGAKGPDTFDCSGLMQAAWAAAGVGISAGTLSQIHDGVAVAGLADLAPGDLLFTPGSLGTPTNPRHVGIYAGHSTVIEAHSTKTGVKCSRSASGAQRLWRSGGWLAHIRVRCPVSPSLPRRRPRDLRCRSAQGEYAVTQSSPKLTSPIADRDLLVMGGVCAFGVAMMAVNVELVLAAGIAAALLGGPLQLSPPDGWIATGVRILADAGDPGAELSPPWTALAGHPVVYWAVAVVLLGGSVAAATPVIGLGWRRWGPTPAGHATRREIRRELSLAAARRTAEWTRPGLSAVERARAPLEEVGAPLHLGPTGAMCSPLTSPTGTIAPTQTGKSRGDLVHKGIGAPGALLCSTTKPDLLEFVALTRTRRRMAGPVLVFDATGTTRWPAQLRWSPISGCDDWRSAYQRAHTMVEAAAVNLTEGNSGNDRVFRERATMVVAAYLLAAALYGRGVGVLVRWSIGKPPSTEPADLLEPRYPQLARNLRAEIGMVAQTSDAVWLSVRRVIEPFLDPNLLELCSPRPGRGFTARTHIAQGGSLFLIAGQHQAAHAVPILTALAEHWLTTAQQMALEYPSRRLDPPATAVLDELCNATPIPQLPDIISDSAGRGVIVHWAAQSAAQLEDTFTPVRARQLLDNTTTMSIWGGLKDARTLAWISTLTGHREQMRWQQFSEGLLQPGRSSLGTETVPTYRPGEVRTLDPGRVLVIHRNLDPILARAVDVSRREDWRQIRRDVDVVRSGYVEVDVEGFTADHATPNCFEHLDATGSPRASEETFELD